MKQLFAFTFFVASLFVNTVKAQSDDRRNAIQLAIVFGGKTIKAELNSVSTSVSRYYDEELSAETTGKDTGTLSSALSGRSNKVFSLSMEVRKMDIELLKVLAKRKNSFDGTITITDTYGKNPTKTLAFKQAGLANYSDQYSTASYNDTYGNISLSISCAVLAIDGVNVEP